MKYKNQKEKQRKFISMDNIIDDIIELNEKLNSYSNAMDKDSFMNSREVEEIYEDIACKSYDLHYFFSE